MSGRDYSCAECGRDALDSYMVYDFVWLLVMPSKHGLLHLECLERRLGRPLTLADFTAAPVNNVLRFGVALGRRL